MTEAFPCYICRIEHSNGGHKHMDNSIVMSQKFHIHREYHCARLKSLWMLRQIDSIRFIVSPQAMVNNFFWKMSTKKCYHPLKGKVSVFCFFYNFFLIETGQPLVDCNQTHTCYVAKPYNNSTTRVTLSIWRMRNKISF